jgi:CRISPR type IV-associated protein Csf2
MKKQNIIIDAVITTRGPLSIAMPVAQGGRANEFNNFPLMARGQDEEGKLLQTAYLPASTVRGFLRRATGLAAMEQRGVGKTTLQQAYSDILGQSADAKEEVDLVKLSAIRDADPILDLFGSWSIKSRLLVSNFLPKVNVLPQAITGVRKDLEDTDGVLEFLTEADRSAYYNRSDINSQRAAADAVVKSLKRELAKAKKEGKPMADLEAAFAIAETRAAALKSEMGDMANSSRIITEFFALPADVALYGRIVIEQAKERDLGLILQALQALSARPMLGAQVARGCGEVAGQFTIKVDGAVVKTVTTGGWAPARVEDFAAASAAPTAA